MLKVPIQALEPGLTVQQIKYKFNIKTKVSYIDNEWYIDFDRFIRIIRNRDKDLLVDILYALKGKDYYSSNAEFVVKELGVIGNGGVLRFSQIKRLFGTYHKDFYKYFKSLLDV
jgi:hypothetical protein